MKNQHQLIINIIGQLKGVDKMLEETNDCFDVLIQMKAIRAAMDSMMQKYLEKEFLKCLEKKNKPSEEICQTFFKELIKK